jgi:hypothetical protein
MYEGPTGVRDGTERERAATPAQRGPPNGFAIHPPYAGPRVWDVRG